MADDAEPRRGDVWLVSFGPAVGVEKTRPAVVVSKRRLLRQVGRLGGADLDGVLHAVRVQLGL